jgi:ribosome biogenesis GTPase
VGDQVHWVETSAANGVIVAILPRRNQLARRGVARHARPQVIAANLDQVVAVLPADRPAPQWRLLDRYLVQAEAAGLPALICITKHDLLAGEPDLQRELDARLDEYRRIGYPAVRVSARQRAGLDELVAALQRRLSLLLGKSGVGKSSLLNALQPGLELRVNALSQSTGKGRHTTTHLELYPLDFGGALIDSPGMKQFGLWDVAPDELADCFPEMRPFIGRCKFGLDCRHDEEPGCAVRKAVVAGQISPYRYQSYQRLRAADEQE